MSSFLFCYFVCGICPGGGPLVQKYRDIVLQFGEILEASGHLISRPGGILPFCFSGDKGDLQSVCTLPTQSLISVSLTP